MAIGRLHKFLFLKISKGNMKAGRFLILSKNNKIDVFEKMKFILLVMLVFNYFGIFNFFEYFLEIFSFFN
jgi:hypothetical protein